MTTASNEVIDQAQIVKLIDHWVDAIRSKDVDARLSNYSKNVSLFDVIEPMQYFGFDAVRKRAAEWFSTFDGPLGYEMHDLRIATNDDVAFSHSLNHVSGTKTDGKKLDMWWRATVCYRKLGDQWLVVHEHNSVPFNSNTGKASLDLQPPFSAAGNS
jgi:ketosteroid isomerase-like protein